MVPLKDILNQEQHPDIKGESVSPGVAGHHLLGTPDSQIRQGHAHGHAHSSGHCDSHGDSHRTEGEEGNLPSPPLSTSPCGSRHGTCDNDNGTDHYNDYDDEANTSKNGTRARASQMGSPRSESNSSNEEEVLVCDWDNCGKTFAQPELLYHHLCSDHVGRKSQKNLQLNCRWGKCNAKTEKRDHITSHLRVHVPLKPFNCSTCNKKFKRPQDLKKHLKIHVESHISDKKKRGPRVGSKRVGKKPSINIEHIGDISGMAGNMYMNINDKRQSIGSDTSLPSPIAYPGFQGMQQSLPPISMQQLVTNELSSYEPIYTRQLGSRLQTVLPPISSDDNLPRTSPMATSNAAWFFSTLSKNMSNSLHKTQGNYLQPQQSISSQAHEVPVHKYLHSAANTTLGTNMSAGTTPSFARTSYPEITHLPPIDSPIMTSERASRLPSLSSVPVLTPRYKTFDRVPQFNAHEQYFSSNQRSTGKDTSGGKNVDDELTAQLASLKIGAHREGDSGDEESDALEDYVALLEKVNVFKDYFMCLLLEDEFEGEEKLKALDSSITSGERPVIQLPKYPQLVV